MVEENVIEKEEEKDKNDKERIKKNEEKKKEEKKNSRKRNRPLYEDDIIEHLDTKECNDLSVFITKFFELCRIQGAVPVKMIENIICLLHKKGPMDETDNYRTISLLNIINKIYMGILIRRLYKYVEGKSVSLDGNIISDSQIGFRENRGRSSGGFCIEAILKDYWLRDMPLYIVFIDYRKAFDFVSREVLVHVLSFLGIPIDFINLLMAFHNGASAKMKLNGEIINGENIPLNEGLIQGSNGAPLYSLSLYGW